MLAPVNSDVRHYNECSKIAAMEKKRRALPYTISGESFVKGRS
jgi:hypothetical protein